MRQGRDGAVRRALGALALAAGAGVAVSRLSRGRAEDYDFDGRTVLLSGGSRGLGLELARRFARQGARLALLARGGEGLERARRELAGSTAAVSVHAADVRDRSAVDEAVAEVRRRHRRIDVLVHCAGGIQVGPLAHLTEADFDEALGVHFWGALHLARAALPDLRAAPGGGRIVHIASIGGAVAVPHLAPYCASKFALVGLSDSLRAELAADGVRVTTVLPGLMRTGSHFNATFKGQHRKEFALFSIVNALPLFSVDAGRATDRIVEACRRGRPKLFISPQAVLLHWADALAPAATAAAWAAVARLLPGATGDPGDVPRTGWESRSPLAPSWLTRWSDRAAVRNNEMRDGDGTVPGPKP